MEDTENSGALDEMIHERNGPVTAMAVLGALACVYGSYVAFMWTQGSLQGLPASLRLLHSASALVSALVSVAGGVAGALYLAVGFRR